MKHKNKKMFAILTLIAFMITLMPVMAFATDNEITWKENTATPQAMYDLLVGQLDQAVNDESKLATIRGTLETLLKGKIVIAEGQKEDAFIKAHIDKLIEAAGGTVVDPDPQPPTPSGTVSVDASIIATKDPNVSIEA